MQEPLVSIITPTYNSEDFIQETITSVLHQTYTNWEMIIVDDCSSDKTLKTLERNASIDKRIQYVQLQKKQWRQAIARNTAIEKAKGKYIAFLDADDLWKPQKLQTQVHFLETNHYAMTFSSYELMNEEGEALHKYIAALPKVTYAKMLKSNYVGNLTGIYNAEKLGKVYMPNLRKRQDWALWLSIIKKTGEAYSITTPLAIYRVRKNSISSNKLNLLKYNYNIYRKALNFGALKSGIYLIRFFNRTFLCKTKTNQNTTMNILILGSGGREHTFTWKLSQSNEAKNIYVAPGNAGTAAIATNVPLKVTDFEAIKTFALEKDIQMVVVGPEDPLVHGIHDFFLNDDALKEIAVIGPEKNAAQLEGSKEFAKEFMSRHHIPTAAYQSFTKDTLQEGHSFLETLQSPYVLKADGLAAGKGVLIINDLQEAKDALADMLVNEKFGDASAKVVVEEFLAGIEMSCFVLTDGGKL